MKTYFISCLAALVIAVLGYVVLNSVQENADQAFTTSAVRLGS